MGAETTLRDSLNTAQPDRISPALHSVGFGDLLNALIVGATATETGLSTTSNVGTLSHTPSSLFDVKATAGTTTGHKELLQGPITGAGAIVPATGQVVWDGGVKLLFATVDAVTTFQATYAQATDPSCSLLQRAIGQEP